MPKRHKAQALDLTDAQIDAIYIRFEEGITPWDTSPGAHPEWLKWGKTFTKTMGRKFDGKRMRNYK